MCAALDEGFVSGTTLVQPGEKPKQRVYWDDALGGFGLIVGQQARTFVVQVDVAGKAVRATLGRWGEGLTAKDARDLAGMVKPVLKRMPVQPTPEQAAGVVATMKAAMGLGPPVAPVVTPAAPAVVLAPAVAAAPAEPEPAWRRITLAQALDTHIRRKAVSKRTEAMMRDELGRHLGDWMHAPLVSVTKSKCADRHDSLTEKAGKVAANRALRFFRACWRSAFKTVDDAPEHPVSGVTFNKSRRKREPIPWPRLPAWAAQVNALSNPVRRDLYWMLLLTGLRSEDCRTIRWDHVNLTDEDVVIDVPRQGKAPLGVTIPARSVYRPRPKGGEDRAFSIPLSAAALDILKRRKTDNPGQFGADGGWVFPTRDRAGRITHVCEPKEQSYYKDEAGKLRKRTSIASPHRCRDTFATACNEAKVDLLTIKVLMNHLPPEQDVTLGYMGSNVDHLRTETEKVSRFLLDKAKTVPAAANPAARIGRAKGDRQRASA